MALLLTILLTILKVIGIVLLVILGLILLILAVILFVPVRYRISGELEENIGGEAGISWLGPLIRISGGYYMDRKLFYWVKVLGLLVYSSGDEKTIFTRFSDWKEKRAAKKRKKEEKEKKSEIAVKEDKPVIEEQAVEEKKAVEKPVAIEKKEEKPTETSQFTSYAEQVEYDNNTSDYNPVGDSSEEKPGEEHREGPAEKLKKFIKKIQTFSVEAKNKTDAFYEKVEDVMDKIEAVEDFYYENESQYAMEKMVRLIKRTVIYVLPVKGDGYICYGWWDPATTGKIYAVCCALGMVVGRRIEIIPDFSQPTFHGEVDVKGRLRLFYFVRTGLVIILDKKLRNVYKKGKKVIGHE